MQKKISSIIFVGIIFNILLLANSSGFTAYAQSTVGCWVTQIGTPREDIKKPECTTSNGTGGGSVDSEGFVYYCQMDPKWNPNGSTCMQNAGCGPTSFAMVMSTFGVQIDPLEVDTVFQSTGWRPGCQAGSIWGAAIESQWFRDKGFEPGPNVGTDLTQMKNFLDQGYLIISSANNYPCLGCVNQGAGVGHVFVIDDVDIATNRIRVRDPNNCNSATGEENKQWMWVSLSGSTNYENTSPYSAAGASWVASYPVRKT